MKNYWRSFKRRLTHWITKEQADSLAETFYKYHGSHSYGRQFIIKRKKVLINHKMWVRYAIFIREENKLRRVEDKEIAFDIKLTDLLLSVLSKKQEGVSIFKTASQSL